MKKVVVLGAYQAVFVEGTLDTETQFLGYLVYNGAYPEKSSITYNKNEASVYYSGSSKIEYDENWFGHHAQVLLAIITRQQYYSIKGQIVLIAETI